MEQDRIRKVGKYNGEVDWRAGGGRMDAINIVETHLTEDKKGC